VICFPREFIAVSNVSACTLPMIAVATVVIRNVSRLPMITRVLSRGVRSGNRRVSSEFDVSAEYFEFSAFRFPSFYTRVRGASKTNYSIIHCGGLYAGFLDGIFPGGGGGWPVKSTIIIFRLSSFQKLHITLQYEMIVICILCCLLLACYYMIILCHRVIP